MFGFFFGCTCGIFHSRSWGQFASLRHWVAVGSVFVFTVGIGMVDDAICNVFAGIVFGIVVVAVLAVTITTVVVVVVFVVAIVTVIFSVS